MMRVVVMVALLLAVTARAGAVEAPTPMALHDSPRPLPGVHFVDSDGAARSLADFRGKVVLLNVWATWCLPCRAEMPTLDGLQATLGGARFEVVALSIDRGGRERVERFFREIGIRHLALYVDRSGRSARELAIAGLPTSLLIDQEGRELGRLVGVAEWNSPDMVAFMRTQIERASGAGAPGDRSERQQSEPTEQ